MKTFRLMVLAGLALLVVAFIVAVSTPYWFATKREATVDIRDPVLIQQGAYLARAGHDRRRRRRRLCSTRILVGRVFRIAALAHTAASGRHCHSLEHEDGGMMGQFATD